MAKEWFTIAELRATGLPSMTEARLKKLIERFGDLSPLKSRTRVNDNVLEAEFHISMFPQADQIALQGAEPAIGFAQRIYRLGIHRDVGAERARYRRGDDETAALIGGLDAILAKRRTA